MVSEETAEEGWRAAVRDRLAFEAAAPGTREWDEAAARYATTSDGIERLTEAADDAETTGAADQAVALRAAIKRGNALVEADAELARVASLGHRRVRLHDELDSVAATFGVGAEQVRRDHLISHILGALTTMDCADELTFIGGTALSRTFLPNLRLSEDIDLITRAPRGRTAEAIQSAVARGLQRSHGAVDWVPQLTATSGSQAATLWTPDGSRVQVQLLSAEGYESWPTQKVTLIQRYTDAPPASLTTFTAVAFAAAKTATWASRFAPRDLYDLWALGEHGYIDAKAAGLYRRYGPTGSNPAAHLFRHAPTADAWSDALDHQTMVEIGPDDALDRVGWFWARATR